MRLSSNEQLVIRDTILSKDPHARIYLYGSRTNPNLKGGDIDLLVISDTLELMDKIDLLIEIKKQIGDQKIDFLLIKTSAAKSDPFVVKIFKEALEIK
jgi:predicted nucleotidyltransferase